MQSKQTTSIYYHVPEDKDSPEQPNYFTIPVPKSIAKLEHIYQFFPLKGTYIFRFKFAYEGTVVWLDVADAAARVPTFKETIVIKANRISWEDSKPKFAKAVREVKETHKVAQQKEAKKQQRDLFDHDDATHSYGSSKSTKNTHQQQILGPTVGSWQGGAQQNLLQGFHPFSEASQNSNNLNLFETSQAKSSITSQQSKNLMGDFEKHGDLI